MTHCWYNTALLSFPEGVVNQDTFPTVSHKYWLTQQGKMGLRVSVQVLDLKTTLGGSDLPDGSLQWHPCKQRSLSSRSPKTLHRTQDHIQESSTGALGIQILVLNFKRTMCDPENLLPGVSCKTKGQKWLRQW